MNPLLIDQTGALRKRETFYYTGMTKQHTVIFKESGTGYAFAGKLEILDGPPCCGEPCDPPTKTVE